MIFFFFFFFFLFRFKVADSERRTELYDDWAWEHERARIAAQEKAAAAAAENLKSELKTVRFVVFFFFVCFKLIMTTFFCPV